MAPKYQLSHDNKRGTTKLINMWGMAVSDNLQQHKIIFSLKKNIYYITQNSSSAVECQQIIFY